MKCSLFIFFLLCCLAFVECKRTVSPHKTIVFGPAFNIDIVLPVRYFIVQAVDEDSRNFTFSPGKNTFNFAVLHRGGHVRMWSDVLDRRDGSFVMRFKLLDTYTDGLSIEVKLDEYHVAASPYSLTGPVYHEQCDCPLYDRKEWKHMISCPVSHPQIDKGFKYFPKIPLNTTLTDALNRFGTRHAFCHYSIVANQVYRKCYGEHVGFAEFSDQWFLSLARKVRLPSIEFLFNLGDWPLSRKGLKPIPVVSWCGSQDTYDLVVPTYDLTKSVLEALDRTSIDMMSVQGNTGPRWKAKIAKGLFRGRDSRQERLDLTVLGRSKPDLFNVGLTRFFFFKYDEKKYGPKMQHIPFFDFFNYKYQLNVDGTVAAYRFPYLLVGDSVVFKQDSPYFEHFYTELEPWVHYIPFRRDLSDIEQHILWAKNNDKAARTIGLSGQQYARDNLMSDKLYCYTLSMLEEYAQRMVGKPQVHQGMEHIPQPTDDDSKCECKRTRKIKTQGRNEGSLKEEL